ncbi:MAG: alpha-ribazole phosphatase [Sporomusaceae bacterium]|nr:alpha-ribazole phosphatase [Sporomusaceae bacterium]
MTKIFYVRHGQTAWNLAMRYQGHTDIPLDEVGLQQAEAVATFLEKEKIDCIYASDLTRALETGRMIGRRQGLEVIPEPDFREIHFGEWEGLKYDQIQDKWATTLDQLYTQPDDIQIPGGESFRTVQERAMRAVSRILQKHQNQTILIASHGGTIRTILCAALHMPLNDLWSIRQDNTALNAVEYYDSRTIVALVNSVFHLK